MKQLFRSLSSLSVWILQPVAVLLVLVVGFVAASQLSLQREPPQRSETAVYSPLVRAIEVTPTSRSIVIDGNGSLEARTRIDLVTQVGGRVIEIHPGLRPGGRFGAGQVLLRIEPRDYELAVASAESDITSAETGLVSLEAESEVAVEEWNRLNPGEECPPLVRLEPQLMDARAKIASARLALDRARLDLERTELTLPFEGRVVEAGIDVGEVVLAGQSVATVYGSDILEVTVPLRTEELPWLTLPGRDFEAVPSGALVRGIGVAGPFEVPARVARVLGELHRTSRLARVVLEIDMEKLEPTVRDQLLPGMFVDVEFGGHPMKGAVEIPRGALREGGVVWLVEQGALRFVEPSVLHQGRGTLLVEGLPDGARLVTSQLEVATDGMRVRIEGEGQ